jgi:xanthine dehydrogenase YagR molybdenum-binding subunit
MAGEKAREPRGDYYRQDQRIPETPAPGEQPAPWGETQVVGRARPRVDAYERVSGSARYPSDLVLPGMLYGAILRCPHPHARVRKCDTDAAVALPGVHAVISDATAEARLRWPYGPDSSSRLFDPHCRFEGECVAAVAAESPHQARDALAAIAVDYQVLDHVSDERRALDAGAAAVHSGGNRVEPTAVHERGDVAAGFAAADVVLEQSYRCACELHTPLELHGCVARWDGDRLTLWESSQGVFAIQQRVAEVLGLPLSRVRVINHYMGGGFGSKLQAGKYTLIAALLARRSARPVKLFLSRAETYLAAGNRPPTSMRLKAGVTADGRLTALEFRCTGASGAYPAGGAALVDWQIRDLYTCPNVRTEADDVYIHAGPARPFRAPGHPQGSWALEQMLDALAREIDMDPVALRLANVPDKSQAREGQPPYSSTGLARCLRDGAEAFGWQQARERSAEQKRSGDKRRGVGMAACLWVAGSGGPPSTVVLKLFADGSVNLNMGASDIGTGTKTVMALVVAEELGVRSDLIQIEHADTGSTQYATPSGGSKTVPTEAPAVRAAAVAVKRELLRMGAAQLGVAVDQLTLRDGRLAAAGDGPSAAVAELDELSRRGVVVGVGHRGPNPEGLAVCPFGAQFCEVEVDVRTGEVRLLRLTAAQESGRVMDRLTFDSQVVGGVTMGIGFGLTEERVLDGPTGKLCNRNWHDYKLPTALDVPARVQSLPIDLPDPRANTTGAKGLGEPVTIPTAAAIANAIFDATGVRPTESPVMPPRLLALLAAARREG